MDLMSGLKEDCVLNRVREIRSFDTSKIKDQKILTQILKQKQAVALKKSGPQMTDEQIESSNRFYEQLRGE